MSLPLGIAEGLSDEYYLRSCTLIGGPYTGKEVVLDIRNEYFNVENPSLASVDFLTTNKKLADINRTSSSYKRITKTDGRGNLWFEYHHDNT